MIPNGFFAALFAATFIFASGVAPAHDDHTTGSATGPQFITDADGAKKPFTDVGFNNDAKNFQFIVMSDRNGANRAGVFEDAIKKINWLQPEFVISVGDLIGGYSTDMENILGQWNTFDGLIKELTMRYFYVPGNHDLSNPGQKRMWEERYGRRYYHFLYHDVLFLVLSTDDPFPVQMGDEQVAYFEKVLKDNPSPRWTMVFMHNPTWRLDPTKHQTAKDKPYENRFSDFDRMLKDRKYTVFAGHTHNYTHTRRNGGHEHIVMATTGGGSKMRGAKNYGEFDHLAWVTMTDDGPIIANLDLGGILPPDVRTSETAAQVSQMERARPMGGIVKAHGDLFTTGEAEIRVKNPLQIPIEVSFDFTAPAPLSVDPKSVTRELEPGAKAEIKVTLSAPAGTLTDSLNEPITVNYTGEWNQGDAEAAPFEVASEFTVGIDRQRPIKRAKDAVTIDGNISEWGELPLHVASTEPPDPKWKGAKDASYNMGLSYDDNYLYIAVETKDNKLFLDGSRAPHEQDGIEIRVDARPDPERSKGRALWNYTDHGLVMVAPPAKGDDQTTYIRPASLAAVAQVKSVATGGGIRAEIAIPTAWLDAQQKGPWKEIRMNAVMHDYDSSVSRKSKHLWWRPDWRFDRNFEGSGTFIKE